MSMIKSQHFRTRKEYWEIKKQLQSARRVAQLLFTTATDAEAALDGEWDRFCAQKKLPKKPARGKSRKPK